MIAGAGANQFGGLMEKGYIPSGQFEDMLYMVRKATGAARQAAKDAQAAEEVAQAAGTAGQETVLHAIHIGAKAYSGPDPRIVALFTNARIGSVEQLDELSGRSKRRKWRVNAEEFLSISGRRDIIPGPDHSQQAPH